MGAADLDNEPPRAALNLTVSAGRPQNENTRRHFEADAMPLVADSRVDMEQSFEAMLKRIAGPVMQGSGCKPKPTYNASGERDIVPSDGPVVQYSHYLAVIATMPSHASARGDGCARAARVGVVPRSAALLRDIRSVNSGSVNVIALTLAPLEVQILAHRIATVRDGFVPYQRAGYRGFPSSCHFVSVISTP